MDILSKENNKRELSVKNLTKIIKSLNAHLGSQDTLEMPLIVIVMKSMYHLQTVLLI